MADFDRFGLGVVRPFAQARGSGGGADSDILDRATAILTEETSYLPGRPADPSSPARPAARGRDLPPLIAGPHGSSSSLDQLRQRAVEAVAALLASAGSSASELSFPWRQATEAVKAGDDASVPFTIDNTEDRPATLTFYSTDLVGDAGYQIPAHLISFEPPSQTIPPRSRATMRMNVAVPLQALAGSYSALVQAMGLSVAKAVVTLDVL